MGCSDCLCPIVHTVIVVFAVLTYPLKHESAKTARVQKCPLKMRKNLFPDPNVVSAPAILSRIIDLVLCGFEDGLNADLPTGHRLKGREHEF